MSTPFLTAQWRNLVMLNYEIEPSLLLPHVPRGTQLDNWNGTTFISLVGFLFLDTRVRGMAFPLHVNFEEVNLRFYVSREHNGELRRGVVFLREFVPRYAITIIANTLYNEQYRTTPMRHHIDERAVEYSWRTRSQWNRLALESNGDWQELQNDSVEEFITEHYWGYTAQRDGGTIEYQVEHPRWRFKTATQATLECDIAATYGATFASCLQSKPHSALLAEGSPVTVYRGVKIASCQPLSQM